jgi:hypothetical protein
MIYPLSKRTRTEAYSEFRTQINVDFYDIWVL